MKHSRTYVSPSDQWSRFAAVRIARVLTTALESDPARRIAVALAGGNTPAPVYRALSTMREPSIDWSRIDLFLSDERMVPPDHPDSNFRSAQENLNANLPAAEISVHHVRTDLGANDAAWKYEKWIRRTVSLKTDDLPVFDLMLLGLGEDGHTASLFPGSDTLREPSRLVVPARHPESGQDRITFTLPLLRAAARIMFLVQGEGKANMVARVITSDPSPDYPAALVASTSQNIFWILDEGAARKLI